MGSSEVGPGGDPVGTRWGQVGTTWGPPGGDQVETSRGGDQVGTRWGTSSINSEIVGENWGRNPHLEPSLGLPGFASGGAV